MVDNKVPFLPIQGLESVILKQTITPGNLYFATDSGKILLDTDEERITLGASGAAVFYSNADGLRANTDDTFTIPYVDLDDQNALPKKDDLIINIADGRFFRVNYFSGEPGSSAAYINCVLIAVSGTGGGGGGTGPGGGGEQSDPKVIDAIYDAPRTFLKGTDYKIGVLATSQIDRELQISYTVVNANGKTTGFGTVAAISGKQAYLPVGKYIAADGTNHGVTINIEGSNSAAPTKTINKIRCIDLKVENDTDRFVSQKVYTGSVSYYVKVYGQIAKTLHIEIDGKNMINPISSPENESGVSKYVNINCSNLNLSAGVHTITAYLETDGVFSNKVHTDFIYHPSGAENNTYVIITKYPERCLSYETPSISYWVYDTSKADGVINTIIPSINGANLDAEEHSQVEGQELIWNVTGLVPNRDNICGISCNGASREVTIYCEYSGIFDETKDDALLLLNANGRSNNTSLERRLQWSYTNDKDQKISANLIDFNWKNNGWCTDEEGRNCLRISNGAKVEIPVTIFKNTQPTTGGFTFEFEFKPYNLYSYNLLTQATETIENENADGDEEVEVKRVFNADLAAISYIYGSGSNAYGFCCGTQDAFFCMSNGDNSSIRYEDNKIMNIAVTINAAKRHICMYVNGIMSGMVSYKSAAELPIYANKIILNSEQCDLDVYNIRIYNKALESSEIVQNYIASKKDMQIYEENSFSSGSTVSLNELISYNEDNPSNATIPYIIFKTTSSNYLPYNKANEDVMCDIKFVNPALDHALALGQIDEEYYKKHAPSFQATDVTLNVQGTSSQKYPRKNFKGKFKNATSWECINEKIEDKKLSKFSIRDGMAEKTFTWKADYMDSSSCHNTGFASYVYDLYKNHPLDYYEGTDVGLGESGVGQYHQKYRTSLFGFPVIAFHENQEGAVEFIGIYNFNLDKGADDTLGMALDKQHRYVNDTYENICECWEMANNMGGRCSFRGNGFDYGYDYARERYIDYDQNGVEIEGTTDLGEDIEVRYHINGDAIEGAWVNRNLPIDKKGSQVIGSKAAFEVLLGGNKDGTGRTGAYRHLETFFKWLNSCFFAFDLTNKEDKDWAESLVKQRAKDEKAAGLFNTAKEKIPEYREKYATLQTLERGSAAYNDLVNEVNELGLYLAQVGSLEEDEQFKEHRFTLQSADNKKIVLKEIEILISDSELKTIYNTISSGINDDYTIRTNKNGNYYYKSGTPIDIFFNFVKSDRKQKFENEFSQHLNEEYCMVYYIMTELLLQFDSRGKNMMFASWGPMAEGGDHIWFPIYYDVDTQLGVNNSGIPSWEYNVEPTTGFNNAGGARAFSTANSLLWQNFHESFVKDRPSEIRSAYRRLRGGKLKIANLNGYYNFDFGISGDYCMKGILPINVFNANQSYKYIEPSITGYVNGINDDGSPVMRKTDAYFYCLQGTRELHRALFLRNRFNYYDSKWMAGSYQPGNTNTDQFWRINAFRSDVDPSLNSNLLFHVKPSLDQYLVIWLDDNEPEPIFAKGGEITEVDLSPLMTNTETYNQQIVHIGGPNYIQEYGNVSLLYVDEFEYKDPAVTKIEMGNENPRYKPNTNYKTQALPEATTNKPLLKVFDVTNVRGMANEIQSIDLQGSIKLEEFKSLGTSLTEVEFADGVNLQKAYFPESLKKINLKNAMMLDKIVYTEDEIYDTIDGVRSQCKPVMYIAKLIKDDGSTNINTLQILSGGLKQHSYKLTKMITEAYTDVMIPKDNSAKLQITLEEVHWTPYSKLGDGAEYVRSDANNYYYATDNASFQVYEWKDEETWNLDILSGRVYHFDPSEVQMADNLDLLNDYIRDEKAHFTSVSGSADTNYPIITGSMYVENDADHPVSEADLFNIYSQYFPSLDIRAKFIEDAYRARFVSYSNGVEKEIFVQRASKDSENVKIQVPNKNSVPLPSHSVFVGWSLQKPTGDFNEDSLWVLDDDEVARYVFGQEKPGDIYTKPEFTFYAIFNREAYNIYFKDTKTIPGETSIFNHEITHLYGDPIMEPQEVPYREFEESSMDLTKRLAFVGWTDLESSCGVAVNEAAAKDLIINLADYTADKTYTFYPVYVEENVYEKPTSDKYFKYSDGRMIVNGVEGYEINGSEDYSVRGKMTIPATHNDYPIVSIGRFKYGGDASHIFFMPNEHLYQITAEAFRVIGDVKEPVLKGVYLPESIISIGNSAFEAQTKLQHISDNIIRFGEEGIGKIGANIVEIGGRAFYKDAELILSELPPKLTRINESCFYEAAKISITELPVGAEIVGQGAFMGCPNVRITNFGLRKNDIGYASGLKEIGFRAFNIPVVQGNTGGTEAVEQIYIWDSVEIIQSYAFEGYGKQPDGVVVYTSHASHPQGWVITTGAGGVENTPAASIGVADIRYNYTGEVSS